jgi:hypothetical protein
VRMLPGACVQIAVIYYVINTSGVTSIRLRDLSISLVVAMYFLMCGVSRCALKASGLL